MLSEPKSMNPYEKINQQLKEDSGRIFHSSNIEQKDIDDLKQAMETAKVVLTRVESNETTDLIQTFINFVIRLCE